MVSYILDASAALRYVDNEDGVVSVTDILQSRLNGKTRVMISAIHWGEVAGVVHRRFGIDAMHRVLFRLLASGIEIVPVTSDQAVRAVLIKNDLKIPYADSFGVVLAQDNEQSVLVTADFDFKPAEQLVTIEFLPPKLSSTQNP